MVVGRFRGSATQPAHVEYGTKACGECPIRERCTRSARGRRIKRYAGDEAKEALRGVMEHPQARKRYRCRQAMVEPVFSVLRGKQGLNRFRPSGRGLGEGVLRSLALTLPSPRGRGIKIQKHPVRTLNL